MGQGLERCFNERDTVEWREAESLGDEYKEGGRPARLFFFLFLSLYSDSQACILPRWVGDSDHSSRQNPFENEKEPACK